MADLSQDLSDICNNPNHSSDYDDDCAAYNDVTASGVRKFFSIFEEGQFKRLEGSELNKFQEKYDAFVLNLDKKSLTAFDKLAAEAEFFAENKSYMEALIKYSDALKSKELKSTSRRLELTLDAADTLAKIKLWQLAAVYYEMAVKVAVVVSKEANNNLIKALEGRAKSLGELEKV